MTANAAEMLTPMKERSSSIKRAPFDYKQAHLISEITELMSHDTQSQKFER